MLAPLARPPPPFNLVADVICSDRALPVPGILLNVPDLSGEMSYEAVGNVACDARVGLPPPLNCVVVATEDAAVENRFDG